MLLFFGKKYKIALVRLIGAVLTAFFIALSLMNPPLLNELRLKFFDFLICGAPASLASPPVVIVDIDSNSLAAFGQWPWPRNRMAQLLEKITAAEPAVVGLDMLFAEPDRTSPRQLALHSVAKDAPVAVRKYLRELPDYDFLLAKSFYFSPVPIVLGYAFTSKLSDEVEYSHVVGNTLKNGNFAFFGGDPFPFLFTFNGVDNNLGMFEKTARGIGFFNVIPDQDSIIRNVPLLINYEQQVYPSLILSMLQTEAEIDSMMVEVDRNGVRSVQVGLNHIPTTKHGELIVNFSGSARTLPYISARDILSDSFDPDLLKDAYVLIGTSAPGLSDLQAVPTDYVFPGVELHGHALNTILSKNFLHRPEWSKGAEIVYLLTIGLLLILLLSKMKATSGALLALVISGGIASFSLWSFYYHQLLIDIVYPLITTWLLFTVLTFHNFFTGEKKIRQLRSAFSQYLSPVVVKELLKKQDCLVLDGEERELSILFSDIHNFTSMAEKMSPDNLCVFLNEYLTPMTGAVMERRGTVDKFIGDSVMAFWNAPLATPNHVYQACECSLEMLKELDTLNSYWKEQGHPKIQIGIGIHCGVARVGNMGSQQRFDYTVMGDAVNLASRLEGLTRIYGTNILVSDSVYAMLKESDFYFRRVDTVRVLGKTTPVTLYQLLEERGRITPGKQIEMEEYRASLSLYYAGDFQAAVRSFQELLMKYPEDKLYKVYKEKSLRLVDNPPEKWDGITDLQVK
ncbi:MAG: adenylate/guanylate cyclase domain-containing protein [Candidatus Electrothrix sp. AR4]|nr:adenylate/guanylate cyclase domain-containing protein [Candidatus Electrothrix sp. AR4]